MLESIALDGDGPVDENIMSSLLLILSTSRHEQLGGIWQN